MRKSEVNALIAIGRYVLTSKDLAYRIGKTQSETENIVKALYEKGYINSLTTSVWFILFPVFGGKEWGTDPEIFLTLTSKGYFYLNPIFGRRAFCAE